MNSERDSQRALWVVHLFTECPECCEDIDLLDHADFWDGRSLDMGEHGTDRSTDMEVDCPSCNASFFVTLEY